MNKAGLRELIQTYNYMYKKDIFAYQLAIIDELECYIEIDKLSTFNFDIFYGFDVYIYKNIRCFPFHFFLIKESWW